MKDMFLIFNFIKETLTMLKNISIHLFWMLSLGLKYLLLFNNVLFIDFIK